MRTVINFPTRAQLALWKHELVGQISDGMWENARPNDHYEFWCRAEAVCYKTRAAGVYSFLSPKKRNYGFNSSKLLSIIGTRMIGFAKMSQIDSELIDMGEYIEEYKLKTMDEVHSLVKQHTYIEPYIKHLNQDDLDMYWREQYDKIDLKKDLSEISYLLKIHHYSDF